MQGKGPPFLCHLCGFQVATFRLHERTWRYWCNKSAPTWVPRLPIPLLHDIVQCALNVGFQVWKGSRSTVEICHLPSNSPQQDPSSPHSSPNSSARFSYRSPIGSPNSSCRFSYSRTINIKRRRPYTCSYSNANSTIRSNWISVQY